MKHGPLIFLGVLAAVMASWLGAVVAPYFQMGDQELIALETSGMNYPLDRQGDAKQGAQVYRAQGCNYCHTQQVLQEPLRSRLTLADPGTNASAITEALLKVRRDLDPQQAASLVQRAPSVILDSASAMELQQVSPILTNAGARLDAKIANLGPDLRRGWGNRRTVSRDYLRDQPVMLGQVRFGPDLANVGARLPDPARLLRKLYDARLDMPGSTMPRYRYLFEERRLRPGQAPSPQALSLPEGAAPASGVEVIPKPEALQLVAYLLSLKSDELFYEVFPPQSGKTNAVETVVGSTNAATSATDAPARSAAAAPTTTNAPTQP